MRALSVLLLIVAAAACCSAASARVVSSSQTAENFAFLAEQIKGKVKGLDQAKTLALIKDHMTILGAIDEKGAFLWKDLQKYEHEIFNTAQTAAEIIDQMIGCAQENPYYVRAVDYIIAQGADRYKNVVPQ